MDSYGCLHVVSDKRLTLSLSFPRLPLLLRRFAFSFPFDGVGLPVAVVTERLCHFRIPPLVFAASDFPGTAIERSQYSSSLYFPPPFPISPYFLDSFALLVAVHRHQPCPLRPSFLEIGFTREGACALSAPEVGSLNGSTSRVFFL